MEWYVKVLIGLLFYFFVVLPVLTVSRVWGYFVHGSAISSFGVEWCGAGGLQFQFSVNFFAGVDRVLVWGGSGHWAVGFGFVVCGGVGAGLWFYWILRFT